MRHDDPIVLIVLGIILGVVAFYVALPQIVEVLVIIAAAVLVAFGLIGIVRGRSS